jgi:hypothetical protein
MALRRIGTVAEFEAEHGQVAWEPVEGGRSTVALEPDTSSYGSGVSGRRLRRIGTVEEFEAEHGKVAWEPVGDGDGSALGHTVKGGALGLAATGVGLAEMGARYAGSTLRQNQARDAAEREYYARKPTNWLDRLVKGGMPDDAIEMQAAQAQYAEDARKPLTGVEGWLRGKKQGLRARQELERAGRPGYVNEPWLGSKVYEGTDRNRTVGQVASKLAHGTVETAMTMGPPLVIGWLSGGTAAPFVAGGLGGLMEGEGAYSDAVEKGMTPDEALDRSGMYALASAGLNTLGFGKMLEKLPKGKVAKLFALAVDAATESGTEMAEEPVQRVLLEPKHVKQSWDHLVQTGELDEFGKGMFSDMAEVGIPSLLLGAMGGAGSSIADGARGVVVRRQDARLSGALKQVGFSDEDVAAVLGAETDEARTKAFREGKARAALRPADDAERTGGDGGAGVGGEPPHPNPLPEGEGMSSMGGGASAPVVTEGDTADLITGEVRPHGAAIEMPGGGGGDRPDGSGTDVDPFAEVGTMVEGERADGRSGDGSATVRELMRGGMSALDANLDEAEYDLRRRGQMRPDAAAFGDDVEGARRAAGPYWREYLAAADGDEGEAAQMVWEDEADNGDGPAPGGVGVLKEDEQGQAGTNTDHFPDATKMVEPPVLDSRLRGNDEGEVNATAGARRYAEQAGVALGDVAAALGVTGKVREWDVSRYVERRRAGVDLGERPAIARDGGKNDFTPGVKTDVTTESTENTEGKAGGPPAVPPSKGDLAGEPLRGRSGLDSRLRGNDEGAVNAEVPDVPGLARDNTAKGMSAKAARHWQEAYRKADPWRKADILEAVAEKSKSPTELDRVLANVVKGQPNENRILYALAQNQHASAETVRKAQERYDQIWRGSQSPSAIAHREEMEELEALEAEQNAGGAPAVQEPPKAGRPGGVTRKAKEVARKLKVDVTRVKGTGTNGTVLVKDVKAAAPVQAENMKKGGQKGTAGDTENTGTPAVLEGARDSGKLDVTTTEGFQAQTAAARDIVGEEARLAVVHGVSVLAPVRNAVQQGDKANARIEVAHQVRKWIGAHVTEHPTMADLDAAQMDILVDHVLETSRRLRYMMGDAGKWKDAEVEQNSTVNTGPKDAESGTIGTEETLATAEETGTDERDNREGYSNGAGEFEGESTTPAGVDGDTTAGSDLGEQGDQRPAEEDGRGTSDSDRPVSSGKHSSGTGSRGDGVPGASVDLEGQSPGNGDRGSGPTTDRDELVPTADEHRDDDARGTGTPVDRAPENTAGNGNYDLRAKEPIRLTKGQRKAINAQVKELLARDRGTLTEAEKDVLRQYTGEGGLASGKNYTKEALNQHYTDYETIRVVFDALAAAGVPMQNALEPAVGSGNFVGNSPSLEWTTVDIDATNHGVVQALYPNGTHYLTSFEQFTQDGFDLVISNVPFLETRGVGRRKARPDIKALHDFYFIHALDLVKSDGVVAFITSTGTMDKLDGSIRKEIVSKADVIGSFRLPGGHFEANAHTSVTTDIIFMQRRPDGVVARPGAAERNALFVESTKTNDGVALNRWYQEHPEAVLGVMELGKNKLYGGRPAYEVHGPARLGDIAVDYAAYGGQLTVAVDSVSAEVIGDYPETYKDLVPWVNENNLAYRLTDDPRFAESIDIRDGVVYIAEAEVSFKDIKQGAKIYTPLVGDLARQIVALDAIRREAVAYQNGDTEARERGLRAIGAYADRFKKHPQKDRKLKRLFKDLHEQAFFAELGSFFDDAFVPADVFYEQVRHKDGGRVKATRSDDLRLRALAAENEQGVIALPAEGIDEEDIPALLNNGYALLSSEEGTLHFQNDILYYSGNIYVKLALVEQLAADHPEYADALERQQTQLEAIKPTPKGLDEIYIHGSETWFLPFLKQMGFVRETFNDNGVRELVALKMGRRNDVFERWLNNKALVTQRNEGGVKESMTSYKTRLREAEATVREVLDAIKQRIAQDPDLLGRVESTYNSRFRNYVAPNYQAASYLIQDVLDEIAEHSTVVLRKNQVEWVVQALYEGRGINAHDVGGGKTMAAITLARALQKRGRAKKPVFVVPAKTIKKWVRETKALFPEAVVIDLGNLAKETRQRALFDVANTNADYVFISHEGYGQIKLPVNAELEYAQAVLAEHVDDPDAGGRSQGLLQEKMDAYLDMLQNDGRDTRLTFDKLGFDCVIADEAHNFKNIGVNTTLVKDGLGIPVGLNVNKKTGTASLKSARSYDFRFKANYVSGQNSGKNVFLLTATPTPNKPIEIYTMLRHLSLDIFDEYGIHNDRQFADVFFNRGSVVDPVKNKPKSILRAIVNAQELREILNRYVDKRSMESMPHITIPKELENRVFLDSSDEQVLIQQDLQKRRDSLVHPAPAGADTLISIYSTGRAASADPRLYGGDHAGVQIDMRSFDSNEDKIEHTLDAVSAVIAQNPSAGQLIFLDNAGHTQVERGVLEENIHTELKRLLVERGLKPTEVGIINGKDITTVSTGKETSSGKADEKKQALADAYNAGKMKVLIGSTTSMGEGMDLQVKTTDIYHLDIPYTPGAFQQRNGRGVRPGNENDHVNIHYLMMRGSFDALSYNIVRTKKGWNEALWDKAVADVISTEEEFIQGAIPSQKQILIELESDPVKKMEMEVSFTIENKEESRRAVLEEMGVLKRRAQKEDEAAQQALVMAAKHSAKLAALVPSEKIKDEAQRQDLYEKSRSHLEDMIQRAHGRADEFNAKRDKAFSDVAVLQKHAEAIQQEIADLEQKYYPNGDFQMPDAAGRGQVEKVAEALGGMAENGLPVTVVEDASGLPDGVRQARDGTGVRGVYVNGRVYLVVDGLRARAAAMQADGHRVALEDVAAATWMHEQYGHHGVRGLFPDGDVRTGVLLSIWDRVGKARIQAAIPKFYHGMSKEAQAEEYLARVVERVGRGERVVGPMRRAWDAFVTGFRRVLRRVSRAMGYDGFQKRWRQSDVEALAREAVAWVRDGQSVSRKGAKAQSDGGVRYAAEDDGGFVGKRFGEIAKRLEVEEAPRGLLSPPRREDERRMMAYRVVGAMPEGVIGADGRRILIKNPEAGKGKVHERVGARVMHMITYGGRDVYDDSKFAWLPMVPDTLEQAQVVLRDAKDGTWLYVRRYEDRVWHAVVVSASLDVIHQDVYDLGVKTQFPGGLTKKRAEMKVDWDRNTTGGARDASRVTLASSDGSRPSPPDRKKSTTESAERQDEPRFAADEVEVPGTGGQTVKGWMERSKGEVLDTWAAFQEARALRDVNARPNLGPLDTVLGTIAYYSKKVPALKRAYEAALTERDRSHGYRTEIFGEEGDPKSDLAVMRRFFGVLSQVKAPDAVGAAVSAGLDAVENAAGAKWGSKVKALRARVAEARRLTDYLWQRDRDAVGYRAKEVGPDRWEILNPAGEKVGEAESENAAWSQAFDLECADARNAGFCEQAVAALRAVRMIHHREHMHLMRQAEGLRKEYDEEGVELPRVVVRRNGEDVELDVFAALTEMGDRRGHYMPRNRTGRYKLTAAKNGQRTRVELYDTAVARLARAAVLRKQGYTVSHAMSETPSEDAFSEANLVALQDLLNNAMRRMDSLGKDAPKLADFNMSGHWSETKDGKPEFVVTGHQRSAVTEVMKTLGGQFYDAKDGTGKVWHFVGAEKALEEDLARAIAHKLYGDQLTLEAFGRSLADRIAGMIHEHGSRSHKIGRSGAVGEDVAEGYDLDVVRAVAQTGSAIATGSARNEVAQAMLKAVTGMDVTWRDFLKERMDPELQEGTEEYVRERHRLYLEWEKGVQERRIDSATQGRAFKEAQSFMKEVLRNDEAFGRVMGTLRGLTAVKFLSGPMSGVVNMTALATTVPAAMHAYGGIGFNAAPRLLYKGMTGYWQARQAQRGKGAALEGEMGWLFNEIMTRGYDEQQLHRESIRAMQGKLGAGMSGLADVSMWVFGQTERANRASTIAGAYLGLKEQHKGAWDQAAQDAALLKAKEISDRAHGVYGKVNLLAWARGGGWAGQVARSAYMFKTFSHNVLQLTAEVGWKQRDAKAVAWLMVSPAVLAGPGALMGKGLLMGLVKKVIGLIPGLREPDDPEEWFYDQAEEYFGAPGRRLARSGVAGVFGVNIQGSLALQLGWNDLPTSIGEVLGAPYSAVADVLGGTWEMAHGNFLKGAEKVSPRIVSGGIRAAREATQGVTGKGNQPLFYGTEAIRPTKWDTMVRIVGGNPARLGNISSERWAERKATAAYQERRQAVYDRIRLAFLDGPPTRDEWLAIVADIEEYNARVRAKRPGGVSFMTKDSVRQMLRNALRPPKAERERSRR